jgi:hypothetical protein
MRPCSLQICGEHIRGGTHSHVKSHVAALAKPGDMLLSLSLSLLSSLLCGTSSLSYVDLYREPKTTHTSKWRQLPCSGLSEPKRDSPGPSRFLHSWWNGGAPPSANLGLGMGPTHSTPLSHSCAQMGRRDHRCHCPRQESWRRRAMEEVRLSELLLFRTPPCCSCYCSTRCRLSCYACC